jgi:hypothetical protein
MAVKVKLKDVRLSFPSLFEAKDYQDNGKFRYSATFLVVPGSENDKVVQAAIQQVAAEEFGKTAAAKLETFKGNPNKYCYVRGETKEFEGYAGMLALSSHRKQEAGRPLVIDQQKNPLQPSDGKPYAGCYVNATVEIWAQGGQNAGIRCALLGVQFARDGDAFSGGAVASPDDFDAIEDGAAAADLV